MRSEARSLPARLLAGADAALVALAMGIMYALIAYAALGPGALPAALLASVLTLVVGGTVAAATGTGRILVAGPTASGTLVLSAMVFELQSIPGAGGRLEPALFAAVVVVASCGAMQLLFARLCLGKALKFVPFPVLAGFSNTVALSLIVSMLPSALGQDFPGRLVQIGQWFGGWRPGATLVAAAATLAGFAVARWWPRLPAVFGALVCGALVHLGLQAAGAGSMLGPTLPLGRSPLPSAPDWQQLAAAYALGTGYWSVIFKHALMLAVLSSLFSLMTAARLASALDPQVDGNRLLRSQGLANLASGCCGGLPVAVLGPATVPLRAGGDPPVVSMAVYLAVLIATFTAGHAWLAQLPMAAVAGAVFVASRALFDVATPVWIGQVVSGGPQRADAAGPLLVGALVVGVGLVQGLAAALFVGALAATALLAVELRRGVVLGVADGRMRRSRRVRAAGEAQRLDALGERLRVVELGHWLYFGTADELGEALDHHAETVRWLLLDMHRVAGVDVTAARSLVHAAQRVGARGVRLVVAGFPPGDPRRRSLELFAAADGALPLTLITDLDEALELAEDDLLGTAAAASMAAEGLPLPGIEPLAAQRLLGQCETLQLDRGAMLFRAGDPGDALYAVRRGRMSLRVERPGLPPLRLLSFGPGVVFGEMALLDGHARSVDAVADTATELAVLRRDRFDALARTDPDLHRVALQGIALHLVRRLRETTALVGGRG